MEVKEASDQIPETIIPEARVFVKDILDKLKDPVFKESSYGHGMAVLVQVAIGGEDYSPERQRVDLKEAANLLITKYGPGMINFMRPELREALGLEEK